MKEMIRIKTIAVEGSLFLEWSDGNRTTNKTPMVDVKPHLGAAGHAHSSHIGCIRRREGIHREMLHDMKEDKILS